MSVSFQYAARTNLGLGTKDRNEDSAYAGPDLLVLCDGMGGHAAGDVASSLVVGELVHLDGESHGADDMLAVLERAVLEANDRLAEVTEETSETDGMGTTCIAMLRSGAKLAVANIGDSRAYLRRGSRVTQITKDHSFVQQLLDEGRIEPDEALHHPQRSLVTRVMTGREDDHPDLSMRELRVGDRLMICSDGLTDYVAEETVADILQQQETPGECADRLVELALRASTRDNVTVVVADAVEEGEGTTKPQVVGAASKRRGITMLTPQTPAEKAAALMRKVRGDGGEDEGLELDDDGESSSPFVVWLRRGLVTLAVLAVVGLGGWATYDWSQRQYFVAEAEGYVAIYRGVSQDLGPISLSELEETTDVEVTDLPVYYQQQVHSSLSADDRAGAESIVQELRFLTLPRCSDLRADATEPIPVANPTTTVTVTVGPDGAPLSPDQLAAATSGMQIAGTTAGPDAPTSTPGPEVAAAPTAAPAESTAGPTTSAPATAAPTQAPLPTQECRP